MCGIVGRISLDGRRPPTERGLLLAMMAAIAHRGPDERGIYRDDRAALGHVRLSLLDLTTGQQPMVHPDGDTWIVFNGEIHNHTELRRELEAKGCRFRTRSDTEVALQAYTTWGPTCFSRFNGQWALALWNRMSHELVLARDPVGICPLHVHEQGDTVWFASEAKALFVDPDVPRQLDPAGMAQTFTYWAAVAPTTVFAGIEQLAPGTYRTYRDGRRHDTTYWRPEFPAATAPPVMSLADATDRLRAALVDATRLRLLRADVPVGAYVSGGLDSAVVAALARASTSGPLHTFSLAFDDAEFDERTHQRHVIDAVDSVHETVVVNRGQIADVFPTVVEHAERPLLRTAPAPLFILSQLVADHGVKAVLTGEGADEFLGGYDIFREAKIREFWARRPDSVARPRLFERLYPYLARSPAHTFGMATAFWKRGLDQVGRPGFSHQPRWGTTSALQRMFAADFAAAVDGAPTPDVLDDLPDGFVTWEPLAQAQHLEITTLLSSYLLSSQSDRMLMAHGIEGRFPFLDREVMALCNSLPAAYKLAGLDEKHLLKRVADGLVPPEVLTRPKQPFRAPDAVVFTSAGALRDEAAEALSPGALERAGVFDPGAVAGLTTKILRLSTRPGTTIGNSDNMTFVGVLSTQLLHHQFIDRARPTAPLGGALAVDADSVVQSTRG